MTKFTRKVTVSSIAYLPETFIKFYTWYINNKKIKICCYRSRINFLFNKIVTIMKTCKKVIKTIRIFTPTAYDKRNNITMRVITITFSF